MLATLTLLSLFAINHAKVEYTYSMLFDEYDLTLIGNGQNGIPLEKCDNGGCSIYVAASDKAMEATKYLLVYDNEAQTHQDLYKTATGYDKTTGKMTGLHLAGKSYQIQNTNPGNDPIGPIVIYHVAATAPLYAATNYVEVYDGSRMNRPNQATPYVTIITPNPYDLFVHNADGNGFLQAYVRATGFDGNSQRQPSPDNCAIIQDDSTTMPFRLRINSPIITISFDGGYRTQICARPNPSNSALLDYDGIATSQGYIGCEKNGWQVFRSSEYKSPDFDLNDSTGVVRTIDVDYAVTTKNTDQVVYTTYDEAGPHSLTLFGTNTKQKRTDRAKKMNIALNNQYGSSYLVKYGPQDIGSWPTGEGVCPNWIPLTTTGSSTTTSTPTPTTSGANGFTGLHFVAASIVFAAVF